MGQFTYETQGLWEVRDRCHNPRWTKARGGAGGAREKHNKGAEIKLLYVKGRGSLGGPRPPHKDLLIGEVLYPEQ